MKEKIDIFVEIASLEDAPGVYNALKQNLIEIRDFDKIPKKKRKNLEENGFFLEIFHLQQALITGWFLAIMQMAW